MAGKRQKIRIVVYMPEQASSVFDREQAEEFWTGKISEKVGKSGLTKQQQRQLLQNLVH